MIELIVVMVMTGVLAVAATVSLSNIGDTRGGMGAKHLLRDLTYARQRAVATGTVSWVVFDTAAETWSVLAEDPSSPGRSGATVLTDTATNADFTQTLNAGSFAGVEIVSASFDGDVEIGFNWLGQPLNAAETDLAAQGSVTLTGTHVVNVEALTGHLSYVAP